jgi:hypothetical protein
LRRALSSLRERVAGWGEGNVPFSAAYPCRLRDPKSIRASPDFRLGPIGMPLAIARRVPVSSGMPFACARWYGFCMRAVACVR